MRRAAAPASMPQRAFRDVIVRRQRRGEIDASRLRGGRQGWAATPAPPARGVCPLEPYNGCDCLGNVRCGWLWYAETNEFCYDCLGILKACAGAAIMRQ